MGEFTGSITRQENLASCNGLDRGLLLQLDIDWAFFRNRTCRCKWHLYIYCVISICVGWGGNCCHCCITNRFNMTRHLSSMRNRMLHSLHIKLSFYHPRPKIYVILPEPTCWISDTSKGPIPLSSSCIRTSQSQIDVVYWLEGNDFLDQGRWFCDRGFKDDLRGVNDVDELVIFHEVLTGVDLNRERLVDVIDVCGSFVGWSSGTTSYVGRLALCLDINEIPEVVLILLDFVVVNSDSECAVSNRSSRVHHLRNSKPIQCICYQRIHVNNLYRGRLKLIITRRDQRWILTLNQEAL